MSSPWRFQTLILLMVLTAAACSGGDGESLSGGPVVEVPGEEVCEQIDAAALASLLGSAELALTVTPGTTNLQCRYSDLDSGASVNVDIRVREAIQDPYSQIFAAADDREVLDGPGLIATYRESVAGNAVSVAVSDDVQITTTVTGVPNRTREDEIAMAEFVFGQIGAAVGA